MGSEYFETSTLVEWLVCCPSYDFWSVLLFVTWRHLNEYRNAFTFKFFVDPSTNLKMHCQFCYFIFIFFVNFFVQWMYVNGVYSHNSGINTGAIEFSHFRSIFCQLHVDLQKKSRIFIDKFHLIRSFEMLTTHRPAKFQPLSSSPLISIYVLLFYIILRFCTRYWLGTMVNPESAIDWCKNIYGTINSYKGERVLLCFMLFMHNFSFNAAGLDGACTCVHFSFFASNYQKVLHLFEQTERIASNHHIQCVQMNSYQYTHIYVYIWGVWLYISCMKNALPIVWWCRLLRGHTLFSHPSTQGVQMNGLTYWIQLGCRSAIQSLSLHSKSLTLQHIFLPFLPLQDGLLFSYEYFICVEHFVLPKKVHVKRLIILTIAWISTDGGCVILLATICLNHCSKEPYIHIYCVIIEMNSTQKNYLKKTFRTQSSSFFYIYIFIRSVWYSAYSAFFSSLFYLGKSA